MQETIVIKRYLENPDTTYAILVNGKWGSGKTHYWKHVLVPELISKTNVPGSKENENYKAIYVSLYGIETVSELGRRILYELLTFINKDNKIVKAISSLGAKAVAAAANFFNLGETSISEQDIANVPNLKNHVIAFDDLERISSSDLIERVLGFINYLSEHEGIKVLLFTDESKLKDQLEKWPKIKEKIVNEEISFTPNYESIISQILKKFDKDSLFHQFVEAKIDVITTAFKCSKTRNLRSLKYALDRFKLFYESNNSNTEIEPLFDHILYTCLCISFEFKSGAISRDNDQGVKQVTASLLKEKNSMNFLLQKSTDIRSETLDQSYAEEFFIKYFSDQYKYIITDSLYEYLLTGIEPPDLLESIIEKYKPLDITATIVEKLTALQNISIAPLSEHQFSQLLSQVLDAVKAGDFSLMYYPIVLRTLLIMHSRGLVSESEQEIASIVDQGLQTYLAKGEVSYVALIETHLETEYFSGHTLELFRNKIIDLNRNALVQSIRAKIDQAYTAYKTTNDATLLLEIYYPKGPYKEIGSFFQHIDLTDFIETIIKADNTIIGDFTARTKARYGRGYFQEEHNDLREIKRLLQEKLSCVTSALKRFYLQKLIQTIIFIVSNGELTEGDIDDEL